MTLDAQLWREVGRHLELEALLKRLAPMVRGLLPVDALFVRRLERNPTRLMTVASGACEPGHAPEPRAARSELDPGAAALLDEFLREGRLLVIPADDAAPLSRALLPPGLQGSAIVGRLTIDGEPGEVRDAS